MTEDLDTIRAEISDIDARIAELIGMRLKAAERVAMAKKDLDLPIVNEKAEERVYERYAKAAEKYGVRPEAMESIARILIAEAVLREERVTR